MKESGLIIPNYLTQGDMVGLIAPASTIEKEKIENAICLIESWGLKVNLGHYLYDSFHQYSATDDQRASDFQQMLDNEKIKAIFCVRGGYGTIRIIDKLDFNNFINSPKWIIGYSDITILHVLVNQRLGICSIHATMPVNYPVNQLMNESLTSLKQVLFEEKPEYSLPTNKLNRLGNSSGILTGGNLSVLYSLTGTDIDVETNDKILFIEDVGEYFYHIDRMMIALKRSGKLKNLAGLIIGAMIEIKDTEVPFGKNAYEIIAEHVSEYNYPVCFGFSAGHEEKNLSLIMGAKMDMEIGENISFFSFTKR